MPAADPAVDRSPARIRRRVHEAIRLVEAEGDRSADTHLHVLPLPRDRGVHASPEDGSVHPTGSLGHRPARSPFLHALVNGRIVEGTTVVEGVAGRPGPGPGTVHRRAGAPRRRRHVDPLAT